MSRLGGRGRQLQPQSLLVLAQVVIMVVVYCGGGYFFIVSQQHRLSRVPKGLGVVYVGMQPTVTV